MSDKNTRAKSAERSLRLFVSIPLERHFLRTFGRYRDRYGKIPYLRWVPERNLHTTVHFIGETPPAELGKLVESLDHVMDSFPPFTLTLKRVAYAPPKQRPDMVWAYWSPSEELGALAASVCSTVFRDGIRAMEGCTQYAETFVPHVTLAKFKQHVVPRPLVELTRTELEGYHMLVREIHLMHSRLTPQGSEFTTLATFCLTP